MGFCTQHDICSAFQVCDGFYRLIRSESSICQTSRICRRANLAVSGVMGFRAGSKHLDSGARCALLAHLGSAAPHADLACLHTSAGCGRLLLQAATCFVPLAWGVWQVMGSTQPELTAVPPELPAFSRESSLNKGLRPTPGSTSAGSLSQRPPWMFESSTSRRVWRKPGLGCSGVCELAWGQPRCCLAVNFVHSAHLSNYFLPASPADSPLTGMTFAVLLSSGSCRLASNPALQFASQSPHSLKFRCFGL